MSLNDNKKLNLMNGHGIITNLLEEKNLEDDVYRVVIANMCVYKITRYRIVGNETQEVVLPNPISQNCDLSECDACKNNEKFDTLFECSCKDAPFQVEIYCEHLTKPNGWAGPLHINPDCKYEGTFHCVNIK